MGSEGIARRARVTAGQTRRDREKGGTRGRTTEKEIEKRARQLVR